MAFQVDMIINLKFGIIRSSVRKSKSKIEMFWSGLFYSGLNLHRSQE